MTAHGRRLSAFARALSPGRGCAAGPWPNSTPPSQLLPLSPNQEQEFRTLGFVNAGPTFDEATIAGLSDELDRVLSIGSDGLHGAVSFTPFGSSERPVIQIVNMWEASEAFARVCSHPKIVAVVRQLLRCDDFLVWHDQMQYKPPYHGGTTPWHQDSPAWPIILPNLMLSAWLPLDDANVENGACDGVPALHFSLCRVD